jgi:hypothetical protein
LGLAKEIATQWARFTQGHRIKAEWVWDIEMGQDIEISEGEKRNSVL